MNGNNNNKKKKAEGKDRRMRALKTNQECAGDLPGL